MKLSDTTGGADPAIILLVEDNPADVWLMMEALAEVDVDAELHHTPDGVEALAFLRRDGSYAAAPRPDLILLDLNMPGMDGRAVLAELKQDRDMRSIPVVVLTSSTAERDINDAYSLNCNCYIKKPVDLEEFFDVAVMITKFWLTIATLPTRCGYGRSQMEIAA